MDETLKGSATQAATEDAVTPSDQPVQTGGSIDVTGSAPEIVSDHTTDDLKIVMGEFDGPLDLLLHLIRQEQVNIYDIPVARIADEYLRYLQIMQELDIAVAGDFLVMAATLIELKTRMLLPRDPLRPRTRKKIRAGSWWISCSNIRSTKPRHKCSGRVRPLSALSSNELRSKLIRTIPRLQLDCLIC